MLFWTLIVLGTLCLWLGLASFNNGGYWIGYFVGIFLIVVAGFCFFGSYKIHRSRQKNTLATTVQFTTAPHVHEAHFLW